MCLIPHLCAHPHPLRLCTHLCSKGIDVVDRGAAAGVAVLVLPLLPRLQQSPPRLLLLLRLRGCKVSPQTARLRLERQRAGLCGARGRLRALGGGAEPLVLARCGAPVEAGWLRPLLRR